MMELKLNHPIQADGLEVLRQMRDNTFTAIFFDPQYRASLDKLAYGNEGQSRQKARALLAQMDEDTIEQFQIAMARVLKPSGYLFQWCDSFGLGLPQEMHGMEAVARLTWDKERMGMGYRLRSQCEHLIAYQKKPIRAKDTWHTHSLRDIWREPKTKGSHPHIKPVSLIIELIKAVSVNPNAIIGDFCAGSFTTLDACKATGNRCVVCDLDTSFYGG